MLWLNNQSLQLVSKKVQWIHRCVFYRQKLKTPWAVKMININVLKEAKAQLYRNIRKRRSLCLVSKWEQNIWNILPHLERLIEEGIEEGRWRRFLRTFHYDVEQLQYTNEYLQLKNESYLEAWSPVHVGKICADDEVELGGMLIQKQSNLATTGQTCNHCDTRAMHLPLHHLSCLIIE